MFGRLLEVLKALLGGKPLPQAEEQPKPVQPAPPPVVVPVEPEPQPTPKPGALSGKQKTAAAIAAACAVAAPVTAGFEGFVAKAKPDPIGIQTGCFGERVDMSDLDPSRIYTRSECTDRLRLSMARKYAPPIAKCVPALTLPERKNEFAAMIDSSFNAGPAAVCASPMAKSFLANQWAAGCNSLRTFYVGSVTKAPVRGAMSVRMITSGKNAGKYFNTFRGLVDRRKTFADICLRPE